MRRLALLWMMVLTAMTGVSAQGHGLLKRLTTENGLPSNTVRNIVQDDGGFIWLGTDNGLCRYDGSEVRPYLIAENGADQFIMALQLRGDSLLAATQKGVFCLSLRTEQWHKLPGVTLKQTGREDRLTTSDGLRWTGTWEQGLTLTRNGHTQTVLSPQADHMGNHIHKLLEYDKNTLLIGCEEGLVGYDRRTGQVTLWDSPKFVYSLMRDHEGGLWVGTFYDGVYYLNHTVRRFHHTGGHVISRFCEDSRGRLWVASDDAGLRCLSGDQWEDYSGSDVLAGCNVHALQVVRRGGADELWVGTYTRGVFRLSGGKLRSYTEADGLYDNSSYVIFQDGHGRLWVGTMGGLCRYDEVRDRFVKVGRVKGLPISICDDAQGGRLWIATQGAGLYSYDGHWWRQYRHDNASLADDQVNSVLMTRDGRLWVGTEQGLCLYQPETNDFRRVLDTPVSSIVDAGPFTSTSTSPHHLWLSTPHGVMRFAVESGETMVMNREDGLQSLQFQPNTGFLDSRGILYFGTVDGFCRFQPSNLVTNTLRPRVVITRLEVYDASGTPVPQPSALNSSPFTLHSSLNPHLTLHFASLSYMSPSKNQYAYKLEGFDHDWHYIGSQTHATFTNLPPGDYTFRVKATNNDGLWSTREATLMFTVQRPLWWSWPAWVLYFLLVLAVLAYWVWHKRRTSQPSALSPQSSAPSAPLGSAASLREEPSDSSLFTLHSSLPSSDRDFMTRLRDLIEQHYANPELNVNFLAERMAVSRSGLFAKAKQLADITPNEMIQTVRLNHAAQLLREGSYTVSEVCYRVGFSSPSYFTKCFQKQFGVKPTEWKA